MTHCVYCHTKRARLGKASGFPADLFCSMRCAYQEALERHMDEVLCPECGDWLANCGHFTRDFVRTKAVKP